MFHQNKKISSLTCFPIQLYIMVRHQILWDLINLTLYATPMTFTIPFMNALNTKPSLRAMLCANIQFENYKEKTLQKPMYTPLILPYISATRIQNFQPYVITVLLSMIFLHTAEFFS